VVQKKELKATPDETTGARLSVKSELARFDLWIEGTMPLITHAWSQKAKLEMLQKQTKATKPGRVIRDPEKDYLASLYNMGDGEYGFPAMAVKDCIVTSAHKDKGIARSQVISSLWIDAKLCRIPAAYEGAVCDMPLIRIYGAKPKMREDPVRVGSGLNKSASLVYRAQFDPWAMRLTGLLNTSVVTLDNFRTLIMQAGKEHGIGEFRNDHKGPFGSFRLASSEEAIAWAKFAEGKGPLPASSDLSIAAE
jgi:hypothetical protein